MKYSLGGNINKFWRWIENKICPIHQITFEVPITIISETDTKDIVDNGVVIYTYVKSHRIAIELPKGYKIIKEVAGEENDFTSRKCQTL